MIKESFDNLHKKIEVTAKTRFYASRRLRRHADWSTYTVVAISLGLVLVSMMQAYGLGENIETKYTSLIQVFSAVAVLVYSLIIDKNDYSALSEKMFSCASQLSELKQKHLVKILSENPREEDYKVVQEEYWSILKIYETHANNDFSGDNLRARLDMPDYYPMGKSTRIMARLKVLRMHTIDFISYPAVLLTLLALLKWLWLGW